MSRRSTVFDDLAGDAEPLALNLDKFEPKALRRAADPADAEASRQTVAEMDFRSRSGRSMGDANPVDQSRIAQQQPSTKPPKRKRINMSDILPQPQQGGDRVQFNALCPPEVAARLVAIEHNCGLKRWELLAYLSVQLASLDDPAIRAAVKAVVQDNRELLQPERVRQGLL